MHNKVHRGARTTHLTRKEIQQSNLTISALAEKYNVTERTILKWKKRSHTENLKPGPPSAAKFLTKLEESILVKFRIQTNLPLNDCYYTFKDEIPHLSRSSLYRCFKRHGVNNLNKDKKETKKTTKKFKNYPPGYVHVDITQVYTEEGRLYLFVGIDKTTKFCFAKFYTEQTANNASLFMKEMSKTFPNKIRIVLTDNGLQFTTHNKNSESHTFNKTCKNLSIEHRLTKPFHPWTNGQVERANRMIKEATVKKFYYRSHDEIKKHLNAFLDVYNFTKKLTALEGLTPYEKICLYLQSEKGKLYLNKQYKFREPYIYSSQIPINISQHIFRFIRCPCILTNLF